MQLTNDEIKGQLKDVPEGKRVAIALRSAMRVLPLLAVRQKQMSKQRRVAFWFWPKEDRAKHLLAVYRAYAHALEYSLIPDSNWHFAGVAARAATRAAERVIDAADDVYVEGPIYTNEHSYVDDATYSDDAPYATVRAAADAAYAAADISYATYAVSYAVTAVRAEAIDTDIIILEILRDLTQLRVLSATELLTQPLWYQPVPDDWQQLQSDFKKNTKALNAGFDVWSEWYDDRVQGKPVDLKLLKQWNNIPAEIERQERVAKFNAYLKNLAQKTATRTLNCVRAIFLGYGEAGKTSLIRALHDEPVDEGKEDMTAGIDIRDWAVPDSEIKAHFWDFGGQVIAHATHQFFLRERCLYTLVLNARSEINSNEQAEYWLEHVKTFGNHAPVMLVGNKTDQTAINLDMSYLKDKYPNIVDFYPLSCTQAKGKFKAKFDSFKQDFCQQLCKVDTHQMLFTQEQFAVLEELRDYSAKAAFLKHQEFEDICERYGVSNQGELNREWLLDILDKLGVVIHFPQLTFLDEYVLNPRWLTHGVYTLMYEQKARLTEREAVAILRNKPIRDEKGNTLDYPADKCRFILEAMQEFKLCYPFAQQRNTFIIPELLPSNRPEDIPFKKQGALIFEFKFTGFLPRHIMPELIVTRHQEIVDEIVWQNGVLFKHQSSETLVLLEVSYHERIINIWVQGSDAKDYLVILNDEILKILGRLTDLKYDEYVELPLSARISQQEIIVIPEKADYRQLLNNVKNGEHIFHSKNNSYDLKKVLGIIVPAAELSRLGINIEKIIYGDDVKEKNMNKVTIGNNNNIGGSVVVAEKIKNSFNGLKKSKAGTEVKELLEQLLDEIKVLNEKVPASQTVEIQAVEKMTKSADILVNETKNEFPDKEWYEFSLKGLTEAALSLKELSEPVLKVIETLRPLLLG